MFTKINIGLWMFVPKDQRDHLVNVFGIKRTGVSEIKNEEIISDGYSNADLEGITKEKMEEYIGSEVDSFHRAWEVTLSKCRGELEEEPQDINKETKKDKKKTHDKEK
jgi:hypothetical protein